MSLQLSLIPLPFSPSTVLWTPDHSFVSRLYAKPSFSPIVDQFFLSSGLGWPVSSTFFRVSVFAASLRPSFQRTFASSSSLRAFALWRSRYECTCCLHSGLVSRLRSLFLTVFKFSLDWSILRLSCDAVKAGQCKCCLSHLVQLWHSSAGFTMSFCICGNHRFCETPRMVFWPGWPRWIRLSQLQS